METVHLITHDGVRAICGRLDGKRSSFVSLVTCQRCKDWWEANKIPRKIAPQMYEHYTDLRQYSFNEVIVAPHRRSGMIQCAIGTEILNVGDAVWFGDEAVCAGHEAEYRAELQHLEDLSNAFDEANADMDARLHAEWRERNHE